MTLRRRTRRVGLAGSTADYEFTVSIWNEDDDDSGVVWRYTEPLKTLAPRLRRKEPNDKPLDDFIVKEDTAMEDMDPELIMNPVLLAKLALVDPV